jgi:hypothetical protein
MRATQPMIKVSISTVVLGYASFRVKHAVKCQITRPRYAVVNNNNCAHYQCNMRGLCWKPPDLVVGDEILTCSTSYILFGGSRQKPAKICSLLDALLESNSNLNAFLLIFCYCTQKRYITSQHRPHTLHFWFWVFSTLKPKVCHLLQQSVIVHFVFMYFVLFSLQTAIISLNCVNRLIFVTVKRGVFFAVRAEFLNVICTSFGCKHISDVLHPI